MKSDLSFVSRLSSRAKEGKEKRAAGRNALFADARYRRSAFFAACGRPLEELKKDRGAYGEYLLYDRLRREKGRWLFNLYLPHRGEKTEIDLLLISPAGLFLFESKNFSGRIYGLAGQREWAHTFRTPRGIRKQRFFNPLMQNEAHESALRACAGEDLPVYPMVVFGKNCTLYTPCAKERPDEIMTLKTVRRNVKKHRTPLLSGQRQKELFALLAPFSTVCREEYDAHIRAVTKKNAKK